MTRCSVSPCVGNVKNQWPESDRAGCDKMSLSSWLVATFVVLILAGCAGGQGPPPPAPNPHSSDADIRST
jgi:hypothetical protein